MQLANAGISVAEMTATGIRATGRGAAGATPALAPLGAQAQALAATEAKAVAARFEEVFVQQMVSAMRSSAEGMGGGMFGGEAGADTYAAWFDRCMAERIASGNGVGLARLIERDIAAHGGVQKEPGEARDA